MKLETEIDDETAGRICRNLKEFEPISHLFFDVCFNFILVFDNIIDGQVHAQCSKIKEKAMVLFAEYFAEHTIHTLKLSLANFQQDADSSQLTNLLKPFESINMKKLVIKVGIGNLPFCYGDNNQGKVNIKCFEIVP